MKTIRRLALLTSRSTLGGLAALAGVAALAAAASSFVIIAGIIETPDPMEYEHLVGDAPWSNVDLDGDGVVDFADDPVAELGLDLASAGFERVVAVWSAGPSGDRDVRFAEWFSGKWMPAVDVADTAADEVAPAVAAAPNGDVHVVWQENGEPGTILGTTRRAQSGTWSRSRVLAAQGLRPVVAAHGTTRVLAYERRGVSGGWEVVAAVESQSGSFVPAIVGVSSATASRRIGLGSVDGRLWVQWQHTDDAWAVSEFLDGRWDAPKTRPWDGKPWSAP